MKKSFKGPRLEVYIFIDVKIDFWSVFGAIFLPNKKNHSSSIFFKKDDSRIVNRWIGGWNAASYFTRGIFLECLYLFLRIIFPTLWSREMFRAYIFSHKSTFCLKRPPSLNNYCREYKSTCSVPMLILL